MTNNRETLNVNGTPVEAFRSNKINDNFISLTDIAKYKNPETPADLIKNWMRSRNTIEYLGLWEQMHNSVFNNGGYNDLLSESGSNSFLLSPTKWIKETNAIGITTKPGRYGGTYAQADIAFEFASWISPQFRLYLITDYQQLKEKETSHLNLDWNLNRAISKINYKLHTDAIKNNLIPSTLSATQTGYKYANEADRLNMALFGVTAKEWRTQNPDKKGNIRDYAHLEQLTVLANLESMNAELIKNDTPESQRTIILNNMAREQMQTLINNENSLASLKKLKKNSPKKLN